MWVRPLSNQILGQIKYQCIDTTLQNKEHSQKYIHKQHYSYTCKNIAQSSNNIHVQVKRSRLAHNKFKFIA